MNALTNNEVKGNEENINVGKLVDGLTKAEHEERNAILTDLGNGEEVTTKISARLKELNKKIKDDRENKEKAPKLEAFKVQAKELIKLGYKVADLIKAVKGDSDGQVLGSFPDITIDGKAFELIAGKSYGGLGKGADAIRQIKAKVKAEGIEYVIKHLNDDGKVWVEEKVAKGRGDGFTFPNRVTLEKQFDAYQAKKRTPKPESPAPTTAPKADAKPAAAAAKTSAKK